MNETVKETEKLKKRLMNTPKNGYYRLKDGEEEKIQEFCEGYKEFISEGKTERECVELTVKAAEAAGFRPYQRGQELKAGDKVYANNRGKSVIFAVIGSESLENGANIAAAHIDAPRIDLKQNPLYEEDELALFKTHYYGGIKKYQWPTIPLELHGVVVLKDGRKVRLDIGTKPDDPIFVISDLLPHLGKDGPVNAQIARNDMDIPETVKRFVKSLFLH